MSFKKFWLDLGKQKMTFQVLLKFPRWVLLFFTRNKINWSLGLVNKLPMGLVGYHLKTTYFIITQSLLGRLTCALDVRQNTEVFLRSFRYGRCQLLRQSFWFTDVKNKLYRLSLCLQCGITCCISLDRSSLGDGTFLVRSVKNLTAALLWGGRFKSQISLYEWVCGKLKL